MSRFEEAVTGRLKERAQAIAREASELHASVNQMYDSKFPYSFHLGSVAEMTARYADEVPGALADDETILAIWFGAWFHDSIEDARQTYNDVLERALRHFGREHALMAAEIAYALTNEKGRTRAERADDRYYRGIRLTPFAPLVKMADRLANYTYSAAQEQPRMFDRYREEMPHFLEKITGGATPVPPSMIKRVEELSASR